MEHDVDLRQSWRDARRKKRRIWLSSAAMFFCVVMMANLVVQSRATPESPEPPQIQSE